MICDIAGCDTHVFIGRVVASVRGSSAAIPDRTSDVQVRQCCETDQTINASTVPGGCRQSFQFWRCSLHAITLQA
jgi:hypothetical protein